MSYLVPERFLWILEDKLDDAEQKIIELEKEIAELKQLLKEVENDKQKD
jgi:hypothetical protein